jgi:ribonuclease BN (tRNA processing enzyme)
VGLAAAFFTHSFEVGEYDPSRELRLGALRLTLAPTQHYIQGYAMRFSANGRNLAYSSDTGPTESIPALLHGVQLALVEATLLQQANDDEPPGHLTGREAGALARQARVQRLLLTHYAASIAQRLLLDAKETFGPDAELAQEGKTYEV